MDFDIGTFVWLVFIIGGLIASWYNNERARKKVQERRRAAPPPRPSPPSPFDEPAVDRHLEGRPVEARPAPQPRPVAPPQRRPAQQRPVPQQRPATIRRGDLKPPLKPPPPVKPPPRPKLSRARKGETFAQHLERLDAARRKDTADRTQRFLITNFTPMAPPIPPAHTQLKNRRGRHTRALRKLLTDRNELRDLILIAEILGKPVSQRETPGPAEI